LSLPSGDKRGGGEHHPPFPEPERKQRKKFWTKRGFSAFGREAPSDPASIKRRGTVTASPIGTKGGGGETKRGRHNASSSTVLQWGGGKKRGSATKEIKPASASPFCLDSLKKGGRKRGGLTSRYPEGQSTRNPASPQGKGGSLPSLLCPTCQEIMIGDSPVEKKRGNPRCFPLCAAVTYLRWEGEGGGIRKNDFD